MHTLSFFVSSNVSILYEPNLALVCDGWLSFERVISGYYAANNFKSVVVRVGMANFFLCT